MRHLLIAVALLAASVSAHAQQKGGRKASLHDQVSGQGYGLAGCGLGSIVFGPKPGMIQVVAATLNGTGYQTFAITTGTSNCDQSEMSMAAAAYIEVNREIVMKDAARGEGENISNLGTIYQCSDIALFNTKVKENFGKIFSPELNSYDASRAIVNTIKSDAKLAQACGNV